MTNQDHTKKQIVSARKELRLIINKIDNLGITSRAFVSWHANSQLRGNSFGKFTINRKHFWGLALCMWIIYYMMKNYIESTNYKKCLIETPGIFQKIFRPAEDCSMCADVQQVEKIFNVDPNEFEELYAYSGRPVVVTDATKNWKAMTEFSYLFFKNLYLGQSANCQFFPYKTEFKNLQDVFNMSDNRALLKPGTDPWYVGWSNCDEQIGMTLRQYYHRPYFLPTTAENEKTDWIFMGSPGYGAPMHVDDVDYPSWQAQIKGSKLWILEPPRECHYQCNKLQVIVEPGDIIILDTNRWYHQTKIIPNDLSITIGAEYD
ncbi:hypothetical protein PV328_005525 [Microctonus aethiopoides]|uniref:Cupin-like domain-containing protein n=1 Tax=Microctonus aethiopoides TaxID=144406 RepID=A0AA39FMJ3_9HYME|nr:hypothetical protein PV328_005525 [Microctonus aethiopoides]